MAIAVTGLKFGIGDSIIPIENIKRFTRAPGALQNILGEFTVLTRGKEYMVESLVNPWTPIVTDDTGLKISILAEDIDKYKILRNDVNVKSLLEEIDDIE